MELYLVRHPQIVRNAEDKLSGWEKCKYSELGNIQFEKIAAYFSDNDKVVYSSDLPRAKMLAKRITDNCGSKLIVDTDLREFNFKETAPHDSYETHDDIIIRVSNFLSDFNHDSVIVSHAKTTDIIIEILCGKNVLATLKNYPRDVIFKIETVKNENKLSVIQV